MHVSISIYLYYSYILFEIRQKRLSYSMFLQRSSKQVHATKSTYNHLILDQNIYSIEMKKKVVL